MIRLLSSNWFVAAAGAIAYLVTTFFCLNPKMFAGLKPATKHEGELPVVTESWNFKNPEVDQVIEQLKTARETMAAREQQLKDWETRLASERQEISAVTQTVWRIQQDIEKTLTRIKQEEVPNLKKTAKIYSAMTPDGAAAIVRQQTDEETLRVLFYLKPGESGAILEALAKLGKPEAQRAGQLAEKLRHAMEESAADKGKS